MDAGDDDRVAVNDVGAPDQPLGGDRGRAGEQKGEKQSDALNH